MLLEEAQIFPNQLYKFHFPQPVTNLQVNKELTS